MKRSFIILVVGLALGLVVLPAFAQTSTPSPDIPTATLPDSDGATAPSKTATVVPLPEVMLYTVQRGDTVTKIAQKFHTTTARLIELNKLTDPDHLTVGQDLKVPVFIPTLTLIPSETLTPSPTVPTETATASITPTDCLPCAEATQILQTVNAPTATPVPPTATPPSPSATTC